MSFETFYTLMAIAVIITWVATAALKLFFSVSYRPSSEFGILGLTFMELCAAHLLGWAGRFAAPSGGVIAVVGAGITGIYLVDLTYLLFLRHQNLSLARKRAAILTVTACAAILLIEGGGFFWIMMKAFSQGR